MALGGMIENKINSMDALLSRYVAGSLPKPIEVLVASHLELSASSRELVRGLEACAGEFLADETPVPLTERDARINAILASDSEAVSISRHDGTGGRHRVNAARAA